MRKWLFDIGVVIVAFLTPIHQLMGLTLLLVVIDFVTGIWGAHKRGEKIESKKMAQTFNKLLGYEIGIVVAFVAERYFVEGIPLVKVLSSIVGLVETKSVMENLKYITGVDFIQMAVKKLGRNLDNSEGNDERSGDDRPKDSGEPS